MIKGTWVAGTFATLGLFAASCGSSPETPGSPSPATSTATASTATAVPSPTAAPTSPPVSPTPTPAADPTPEESLEIEIGQMLMAGVAGTSAGDDANYIIRDLHIGNVVLMGGNVQSPKQVLALTQQLQRLAEDANGTGLLIATDQEGGIVQRLSSGFTKLPNAAVVGAAGQPDLTRKLGEMVGEEMAAVGVNIDFAPDLDVNDNPANPVIGPRAFGTTPDVVVAQGPAFMQGLHDAGVAGVGKHFPGHGNTSQNSHYELPVVNKSEQGLRSVEIPPFAAAIHADIDGLMVAHVSYPALDNSGLPATVSPAIVTSLLRDELGFHGVVFTDDMGMLGISSIMSPEEAAVRAVLAGADILLCVRLTQEGSCPPDNLERMRDALLEAVRSGRIPKSRIDASVARIAALKAEYDTAPASGDGINAVGSAAHQQVVNQVIQAAGG